MSALRATVQSSENRIARMMFKLAVELCMMMNVMAVGLDINTSQLEQMRWQCVQEVKRTNGTITFKDAMEKSQSDES